MISIRVKLLIVEIISCLFIILFVYAALSKLLDYENFTVQIGNSPILTKISKQIAWFIPTTEIFLAAFLASTKHRLTGLYGSLTLMAIFTSYIIAILQFSYTIPCSCGGVLQKLSWQEHLVFNIGFTILAAAGIMLYPAKGQPKTFIKE
jgi:Methylamine utilisation protein MauE